MGIAGKLLDLECAQRRGWDDSLVDETLFGRLFGSWRMAEIISDRGAADVDAVEMG